MEDEEEGGVGKGDQGGAFPGFPVFFGDFS